MNNVVDDLNIDTDIGPDSPDVRYDIFCQHTAIPKFPDHFIAFLKPWMLAHVRPFPILLSPPTP